MPTGVYDHYKIRGKPRPDMKGDNNLIKHPEVRARHLEAVRKRSQTQEWIDKNNAAHTPGSNAKRSDSMKGKNTGPRPDVLGNKNPMSDPEIQAKHKKNTAIANNRHPNKSEMKLNIILQEIYPGQIEFVGYSDSKIKIAGLQPDFVFTYGQRKIIEHFGSYWHKPEEKQKRINRYAAEDWDCLVIWDYELDDIEKIKEKIKHFAQAA